MLVQMLVLFQYLLMKDVKFKPASCQSAPDDMVSWVNSNQEKVTLISKNSRIQNNVSSRIPNRENKFFKNELQNGFFFGSFFL